MIVIQSGAGKIRRFSKVRLARGGFSALDDSLNSIIPKL
jgi:hypothetical protein